MGPGYFVIAILGCADGSAACTPLATVPTRYESQATCAAASGEALIANSDLDAPNLIAECRAVSAPVAASHREPREVAPGALRG